MLPRRQQAAALGAKLPGKGSVWAIQKDLLKGPAGRPGWCWLFFCFLRLVLLAFRSAPFHPVAKLKGPRRSAGLAPPGSGGVHRLFYQVGTIHLKREELNRVMDRADELLRPEGFRCIESEWSQHDQVLRVFVGREGGVNMEDCVRATHLLRDQELIKGLPAGSFNLEVSSPGVEPPLRRLEDFSNALGQNIFVHLTERIGSFRRVSGKLESVNEQKKELTVKAGGGRVIIPLSLVHKASLLYQWGI